MDWENPLEKNPIQKSRKTKNKSEIAACEQKITSEKANFCYNTVFSLYFKFRAKKFHAAKPLAFSLHFLFWRDQNHYSNLTSKITKMCEQILKKEHSRQIAGIAAKEKTYVPYNRERNRYRSKLKKNSTPPKKVGYKTFSDNLIKLVKIHSTEASY